MNTITGETNISMRTTRDMKQSKGNASEYAFATLMFASSVFCIWQVVSLAVSFYIKIQ